MTSLIWEVELLARNATSPSSSDPSRPASYKGIGIGLAACSGLFIGTSFVLKKVGLLKANEKYNEAAGEGYGYLRNVYWWGGMILMIVGEICNTVAYAFTDAILVTPLGALSVVVTTVLSAIFLKERLSLVGKVACFLCIVGSVVIVLNGPHESSVSDIQEMQKFFITPGFLSYAGVIIVGSLVAAFYAGPRWGKKNMLVYISICSWIGGLSVVATQGLGAAVIAWINGQPQYKEWFLWVLLVFVIGTLLTEIIYLNKALNLFNAALVTPTYYVYFTSTTIITSAVLFQGFKGSPMAIATVVMGFLTICSGVVLLQLSKSAKDVPDSAVFNGDLDQIHTIAEQEQPESEPKADAIRGAAAIVRKISHARLKMEADELKRLHEEKMAESMAPISEDGRSEYEWDGLRRRRTLASSARARSATSPPPPTPDTIHALRNPPIRPPSRPRSPHPPLGMSRFPTDEELEDADGGSSFFSSIAGTIRGRRPQTSATLPTYEDEYPADKSHGHQHPLPLTDFRPLRTGRDDEAGARYEGVSSLTFEDQDTRYHGAADDDAQSIPPVPPPHTAGRQFSFNRVFRRNVDPTEEERIGLVKDADQQGQPPFR